MFCPLSILSDRMLIGDIRLYCFFILLSFNFFSFRATCQFLSNKRCIIFKAVRFPNPRFPCMEFFRYTLSTALNIWFYVFVNLDYSVKLVILISVMLLHLFCLHFCWIGRVRKINIVLVLPFRFFHANVLYFIYVVFLFLVAAHPI